jgi:molybdopterin synthase catalytic subunit
MTLVAISTDPLDVAAHETAAAHPGAGATVTFLGVVRNHDHERPVVSLEYEAHPSAHGVLDEIVGKFAAHPDVLGIAVSHRTGQLAIGDPALVAVVSCAHRQEAFLVCADLVDAVKHALPIWKRQVFADGTDEWVNCP